VFTPKVSAAKPANLTMLHTTHTSWRGLFVTEHGGRKPGDIGEKSLTGGKPIPGLLTAHPWRPQPAPGLDQNFLGDVILGIQAGAFIVAAHGGYGAHRSHSSAYSTV